MYKQLYVKNNNRKRDLKQEEIATPKNVPLTLKWGRKNEEPKYSLLETSNTSLHRVHDEIQDFKGYSDKCDAAAGLVDLPHVQLLILFQGLLELGRGEASRDTALLRFSHTHHPASPAAACHALRGELAHQREDNVRWPLSPGQKIKSLL